MLNRAGRRARDAIARHIVQNYDQVVDKGVTERPPVEGKSYVAFVVHPPSPGLVLAMAIAHYENDKFVVDLIRDNVSIAAAAADCDRYWIKQVVGQEGSAEDAILHAIAGAIGVLKDRRGLH
jgi:hypothetical protein